MARLVTIEEARQACRVPSGGHNDQILWEMLDAAETYVISKIGEEKASEDDARVKNAILTKCRLLFRPNEDIQGNIERHLTGMLIQICGEENI